MKAICKTNPEFGLSLEKVKKPIPMTNEVSIKILKTAICGTDLHIYQWNEWAKVRETHPNGLRRPLWMARPLTPQIDQFFIK